MLSAKMEEKRRGGYGVMYPNSGCPDGFADDLILGIIHGNFTERIRKA